MAEPDPMPRALKHFLIFIGWNLVAGGFVIYTPPAIGIPALLGVTALYVWGYLLRSPRAGHPRRQWATLRLRPLRGAALGWTLAAVPVLLILAWSLGDVYMRLVPVPPTSLNPFGEILSTSSGRLAISVFAIAIAPIVEEFVFRGLIQREVERRYGTAIGIGVAAVMFAIIHVLPWVLPLHIFLGVTFGYVVWATRSIWSAVILHAANNASAMLLLGLQGSGDEPTPTLWDIGITADLWFSLAWLAIAIVAAAWVARALYRAGRLPQPPVSPAAASPQPGA